MIWGMTLEPGKLYTEVMGDEVHLSMATLESRKDFVPVENPDEKPDSICHIIMKTEKSEYLLCTLVNGNIYQQNLDLKLMPREKVTFSVQGSNVVYLTGYSTSYPDIDDQFEDELSETGDWEPYDMGETSLDNTDEAISFSDEVVPVKGEAEDVMEDVIEDIGDDHVQQPVTVVQLDNPDAPEQEEPPHLEKEDTKGAEDAETQEMIFSIAELEANVKEEPDDGVTIVPPEAEERPQGHDQAQQQMGEGQTLQDTHQQMQQQMQQQTHQQHSQQQMHQQQQSQQQMQQQQQSQLQHLQPQVQFLPNVQSTVQSPPQRPSTSHQRAPAHINQRGPRFTQRPRVGRGRPPLASRAVQRQRMRYMSPSNAQQTFQQQQSSASYPQQMQNVQGSPARMPIAYQGTTVRNVTPSAQMSQQVVNNPQVQGQAMLNQPGTSRQGMAGSSTGNSSRNMSAIALRKGIVTTKSTTCWICGKTFTSTSLCNRHLASHSNFRPYQCRLCDKAFHRSDNCRTHELSHNAKTEFNCRKCGRSYRWRCNRTQHEKKCTGSM
ncbi:Zinc finger and BTB domain-containing protein 24 [Holothuria leucospilota]|uniref:Zinc finger and BTB domain-containing protein 24 n=1 Tax=Holothuria leucospilota TaxID=206669 RepID=A0A9Q1BSY1_HOLLE|nr:Zinc finger and BTB domain-containing protein 24 [Holothuria leucospilota]